AFCPCASCERARELGGPSLRKRCSALVDDELLIDLGPDVMAASQIHGTSLARLHYCLQTHEHADHLDPHHFASRSASCGVYGVPRLHWYASEGALRKAAASLGPRVAEAGLLDSAVGERLNLTPHPVRPFETFDVGPYRVTSLAAAHDPTLVAMLYLIEHRGRRLFYGTDTGPLPEGTWKALGALGQPLNVVVLDHTFGWKGPSAVHLNREQFLEQVDRMRSAGLLADGARVFAHHLAHHSNPAHPDMVELAAQRGYEVAYDGLTIDV
ncbi:MAG: MBL fold metallo-hydrolase, partial [Chloroflexota bacterium]